jgi:hypothetical protein
MVAAAGAAASPAVAPAATAAVAATPEAVPAVTNALSVLGYQALAAAPPAGMLTAPAAPSPAPGWTSLKVGQIVWSGTPLGRVSDAGGQGVLGFALQPVGATAPVNPLPFLASWSLRAQVLHPSVPKPAAKSAAAAKKATAATATTAAPDPWANVLQAAGIPVPGVVRKVVPRAGAGDLTTWGAERMFLLSGPALAREVLDDRRVKLAQCLPLELSRDDIDRRLLAVLEYLTASGLDPTATAGGGCSPKQPVLSLDITAVNGVSLLDGPDATSLGTVTVQRLASLPQGFVPSAVVSDFGAAHHGSATRPKGIVVRFSAPVAGSARSGPLAGTASVRTAPVAALRETEWTQLSGRLNLLGNPGLLRNPALGR